MKTMYRITCGQFTGGLILDETNTVIETAPFLSRLKGKHLLFTLSHILSWDGAIIERVSPGVDPDIPKMPRSVE